MNFRGLNFAVVTILKHSQGLKFAAPKKLVEHFGGLQNTAKTAKCYAPKFNSLKVSKLQQCPIDHSPIGKANHAQWK